MPASESDPARATPVPGPARRAAAQAPPVALARAGLLVALAASSAAAGLGALVRGAEGFWGGLLGGGLAALVLLVTLGVALLGRRLSAQAFAAALLASYLLKLLLVVLVLAALKGGDFYDRTVLGVAAITGLLLALAFEALLVTRLREPYVTPAGHS